MHPLLYLCNTGKIKSHVLVSNCRDNDLPYQVLRYYIMLVLFMIFNKENHKELMTQTIFV